MEEINTLQDLLQTLHVPINGWDLILVGDGSGSQWDTPGGWACGMITRSRETGDIHYLTPLVGAVSQGPINWLEALPYWHGIRHHFYAMNGRALCEAGGVDVHIVSDSEWTVKAMSGKYQANTHADMVLLFNFFRAQGYRLRWHHMRREIVKLNSIADKLSVNAREYINALEYPVISEEFPIK